MLPFINKNLIGQSLTGQKGRYKIISKLGQGGFGETYLAKEIDNSNQWVVKRLIPNQHKQRLGRDEFKKIKELFKKEGNNLDKLNHPQIPKLKEFFIVNHKLSFLVKQEFYLVQEYIEGHDLRDELIPTQRLDYKQVWQILYDILIVLAFVHSKGLIHRDIKPENIRRREKDGKLFIVDFGSVKDMTEVKRRRSSIFGYTEAYTPMEQKNGFPTFTTDVYAVGIIGIEALTGIHPDVRRQKYITIDENTDKIIWRQYAGEMNNELNKLADIIDIMVHPHWDKRYNTATQALEALEKIRPPHSVIRIPNYANVPDIIVEPVNSPQEIVANLINTVLTLPEVYTIEITPKTEVISNHQNQQNIVNKNIFSKPVLIAAGVVTSVAVISAIMKIIYPSCCVVEELSDTYTHQEENMVFTIKYSKQWTPIKEPGGGSEKVKFIRKDQSQTDNCAVEVIVSIDDLQKALSLEEYKNNVIKDIIEDNTNKLEIANENVILDGTDAYQVRWSHEENGCNLKKLERGTLSFKKAYYITYQVPVNENEKFSDVVEKMMDSFDINEKN